MQSKSRGHRRVWTALVAGAVALGIAVPSASANTIQVTITADTTGDDGECGLREAISVVNTNLLPNGVDDCEAPSINGKDTIQLPVGTFPVSGGAGEEDNEYGDLDIRSDDGLTINGASASQSKLDGDIDRVIDQHTGQLTLKNLTVQDGDAGADNGGDVLDEADALLKLKNTFIRDGEADLGGGVRVVPGSEFVMDNSTVIDNTAHDPQGGGGIHAGTPVTITNSIIQSNHADGSFGPGGMRIEGGPSTIVNTTFESNTTTLGRGGAIEVTSSPGTPRNLTITHSVFTQNHADGYRAGGIFYAGQGVLKITHSLFSQNTAKSGGGAIEMNDTPDTLKLSKSVISANILTSNSNEIIGGAAITADGKSTISQTELLGNIATSPNDMAISYGGAINNGGAMRITRSTLFDNSSVEDFGGAIYEADGATLTISNSTLAENSAHQSGGAIRTALDATLHIYNSTFSANNTDISNSGAAIYADGTGKTTAKGSIFEDGTNEACGGGSLVSKGYNVDNGDDCADPANPHDITIQTAKLKQFGSHGGPIIGTNPLAIGLDVFPIAKSSPARNLIPKKKCKDDKGRLKTDEISHERPGGKKCDAGSFEV